MKYAWIENHRDEYAVSRLCRVLLVSRSGYCQWRVRSPSPRALANEALDAQVALIHRDSRRSYGRPRITQQLRQQGFARAAEHLGLVPLGAQPNHTPTRNAARRAAAQSNDAQRGTDAGGIAPARAHRTNVARDGRCRRRGGGGHRPNVYGAPRGELRLRREISRRAVRIGHALSPDDVIITNGCTEAVTLALTAVAKAGDTIAVESPTYFGLLHTLEVLGLKALELPTDPTQGVNVDALARLLDAERVAACMLSSSFSNPLGSLMPEAQKRELLALLARHAVPLIEDDVYGEIHFTRERPRPFVALDGGANTIYCSSFSKSLAPGYRIGWIAPGAFAQQVMDRKLAFSLCGPVLPQVALADFLASGAYDAHIRRLRRLLEENLLRLTRSIEASFPPDTRVSRPAGGFALWVELPRGFDARALFDEALEHGICFAPGDVFSASRRFRNCLRLSAGSTWSERIDKGVRRLGELARTQLST